MKYSLDGTKGTLEGEGHFLNAMLHGCTIGAL